MTRPTARRLSRAMIAADLVLFAVAAVSLATSPAFLSRRTRIGSLHLVRIDETKPKVHHTAMGMVLDDVRAFIQDLVDAADEERVILIRALVWGATAKPPTQ